MAKQVLTPALRAALIRVAETGNCGNVGHVLERLEQRKLVEVAERGEYGPTSFRLTGLGRMYLRTIRAGG